MDTGAVVSIACFLGVQTGALIFFAGSVTTKMESHEKRLDKIEDDARETARARKLRGEITKV